jgi:DNA (cytosine-5)-methyltransferase 1
MSQVADTKQIKWGEMFSGIGGFRLGLEKANISVGRGQGQSFHNDKGRVWYNSSESDVGQTAFRCVWANDWDKYACQIYRKHYGTKELVEADIRTINADAIPDFDLLTAGFPCQSFSLAGKRKGFEDTRGTLFYEVARIAEAKRPRLLLLENVKGLLSNDEGRTFARILQTLDELGYDVEWQVLNSKHFGVPQNRERVFIVGHLRAEPTRQIFPVGQASANANGAREKTQGEGTWFRVANSLNCSGSGKERNLIANTLQNRYYKDGSENLIQVNSIFPENADAGRVYSSEGVARSLKGEAGGVGGKTGLYAIAVETAFTKANMTQGRFSKECHSLDGGKSKAVLRASKIRRLTPVECERLQGFPDRWTEGVSDTQRYKLLGNAVTTNVIAFLGEKLKGCIE